MFAKTRDILTGLTYICINLHTEISRATAHVARNRPPPNFRILAVLDCKTSLNSENGRKFVEKRFFENALLTLCVFFYILNGSSCIYFVTSHSQENTLPTVFRGLLLAVQMLEPTYGTNPFKASHWLLNETN